MHSISFEIPDIGAIDFCLVKSIVTLLRHFMLGQSYTIYIGLMYFYFFSLHSIVLRISKYSFVACFYLVFFFGVSLDKITIRIHI